MKMNKGIAGSWIGLTLLPIVYMFYFMSSFWDFRTPDISAEERMRQFDMMFRLHIITFFGTWGLIASYIVYLFKTHHVPRDKKPLWAAVLFLGSFIAMPVFWYFYVWKPLNESKNINGGIA